MQKKLILFLLFSAWEASFATTNIDTSISLLPLTTFSFNSPRGITETCTIPARLVMGHDQEQILKDQKEQQALCSLDLYKEQICPKLYSTNPGILIEKAPSGMSKSEFEKSHCGPNDDFKKVIAKFKQSVTCSYTPSGLAAFEIGRILDIGKIPQVVLRTMDVEEHKKIRDQAIKLDVKKRMTKYWDVFNSFYGPPKSPLLFTNDGQQIYGHLAKNPKNENAYTEISGVGDYSTRYERFAKQPPFLKVSNSSPLLKQINSEKMIDRISVALQAKEVSDMVLLDYLLAQDDRIGNIHYKFKWASIENGELKFYDSNSEIVIKNKVRVGNYKNAYTGLVQVPAEELKSMNNSNAFLVRMILLKDNDCGVNTDKRSNKMRVYDYLAKLRHMSAQTYQRFIAFANYVEANSNQVKSHFINDLKFTAADFSGDRKSFVQNLKTAKVTLINNCKSGFLQLDADAEAYLQSAPDFSHFNCE